MARKPVRRTLPPLGSIFRGFRGFPPHTAHVHALTDALRSLVRSARARGPRPFYAQRELAAFFRVPLSTVTKACRTLSREQLLVCRRGEATYMVGRRRRGTTVRAVVGLPLWIEGFLYFSDWRLVFVLLEEQLRERDFAPEVIFQRRNRARETELSWRPTGHRLDHVVCFTPPLSELHAMHALRELGTSVVVVTSLPECFPFHVYALRHRTALRRGFEEWARCGLTTAVSLGAGPEEGDPVPALAAAAGLKWRRTLPPSGRDIAAFLESLTGDPRTGLILDDQFLAASLSRNHPDATLAAMRRCRVMVLRSLELPSHLTEGVRIDGVMFDWERLADRIADDLAAGSLPVPGRPLAVEAAWRPRILVDEVPSAGLTI